MQTRAGKGFPPLLQAAVRLLQYQRLSVTVFGKTDDGAGTPQFSRREDGFIDTAFAIEPLECLAVHLAQMRIQAAT